MSFIEGKQRAVTSEAGSSGTLQMRSAQWNIIVRKLEGSGEKLSRQRGRNEVCMYSDLDTVQPMATGHQEGGMKI